MKFELVKTVLINLTFNEEEFLLLDKLVTSSKEYGHFAVPGPGAWWNGCRNRGWKESHQLSFRNIDILLKIAACAGYAEHPLFFKLSNVLQQVNWYHESKGGNIIGAWCERCHNTVFEEGEKICRSCKEFTEYEKRYGRLL